MDEIQLNFNPTTLTILNVILGLVMFGVALDMKFSDFKLLKTLPRAVTVGLTSQFLLLPAFTFLLICLIEPRPSIALGMMLVAACPGGNISNFMTHYAGGNTALSVVMSAIATMASVVMTPLNISFWGSQRADTSAILASVEMDPFALFTTILILIVIPMCIGIFISERYENFANKIKKGMKIFSFVFFIGFILAAIATNWVFFVEYVGVIFFIIVLHNAVALGTGFSAATLFGIRSRERKAVTIEIGIQNSGLGLILIFNYFDGLGGMAIIAAGWGIWHIISGLTVALLWSKLEPTK